jgi:hypothetical protein
MRETLIMPRWAVVGAKVSQIHHYSGAGLGDAYREGRSGKITRVLKTQVEVEFKLFRKKDNNAAADETVLCKFKLRRGYTPYGKGNVRVDILEEVGSKWNTDVLWPTDGKSVAQLRIKKEVLQNSHKMQIITAEFNKKNAHHIGLADVVELMEKLHEAAKEREKLEERILEVDEMPQDR